MTPCLQQCTHPRQTTQANGRTGFTLIELLVVIAVIGVISGFVIAAGRFARLKALSGRAHAQIEHIANALGTYYANNGIYPATLTEIAPLLPANVSTTDPWSRPLVYSRGAGNMNYSLYSQGPLDTTDADNIQVGRQ